MYIPNSVNGKTPVVYQFPGNTQSVSVGFDSTQWWRIANEEGVIIVIMSEAYAERCCPDLEESGYERLRSK